MRVLVVEDSAKMAGLLRKGLERDGHAVDVTGSGDDATWMAVENDYDAIVLDVILDADRPSIDGFDVCRRARQAGCWTPVLMVRRGMRCRTGSAASTSGRMTTCPSRSRWMSSWRGCAPSSGAARFPDLPCCGSGT